MKHFRIAKLVNMFGISRPINYEKNIFLSVVYLIMLSISLE